MPADRSPRHTPGPRYSVIRTLEGPLADNRVVSLAIQDAESGGRILFNWDKAYDPTADDVAMYRRTCDALNGCEGLNPAAYRDVVEALREITAIPYSLDDPERCLIGRLARAALSAATTTKEGV